MTILSNKKTEIYYDIDKFIDDIRKGNLADGFVLDDAVFGDMCARVNSDKAFAQEIADNSVLLLLASDNKLEIDGLIAIAQVSCGD